MDCKPFEGESMSRVDEIQEKIEAFIGDRAEVSRKKDKVNIKFNLDGNMVAGGNFSGQRSSQTLVYSFNEEKGEYVRYSAGSNVTFSSSNTSDDSRIPDLAEIGMRVHNATSAYELKQLQQELAEILADEGWEEHRSWLRKKLGF